MYSFIYSLSKKNKCKFLIYTGDVGSVERPNISAYKNLFTESNFIGPIEMNMYQPLTMIQEPPSLNYIDIPLLPEGNYLISGYFQSYKYFIQDLPEIKDFLFNNISDIVDVQRSTYATLHKSRTVAVHIRRGDYKNSAHINVHGILNEDYYERALDIIAHDRLLIFSDEPDDIAKWEVWKERDCIFISEPDPLSAMILMSFCDSFIIANSSFSLWAWYLRDNSSAELVYPKKWFGPEGPSYDSIVPPVGIST